MKGILYIILFILGIIPAYMFGLVTQGLTSLGLGGIIDWGLWVDKKHRESCSN